MIVEKEFCTRCKLVTDHDVEHTTMSNGRPWRRGCCLSCHMGWRALPLTYQFRKDNGLNQVDFYKSRAWLRLRAEILDEQGRVCKKCGGRPPSVALHVDHIKARSRHPDLALDRTNLQVLCEDCNLGKPHDNENDYRGPDGPEAA